MATFKVTATGTTPTYQWYVDEGTGFVVAVDGGTYLGAQTATLQILSTPRTMNGYKYHVVVSGCATSVQSPDAIFTVNTRPEITLNPTDSIICMGANATMSADATGTSVTWQWWVNKGAGFVIVAPDANFSGTTTKTLVITNAPITFNNWIFQARATGICGGTTVTSIGRLSVIAPPNVITNPTSKTTCENGTVYLVGNGSGYTGLQWQVKTGATWTDLVDDATYVGSTTNQLTILSAPVTLNGNLYRLGLVGSCTTTYTNAASLTVNANPTISFPIVVNACGGVPTVLHGNPIGGSGTYTQHTWSGDVGPLNNYSLQSPTFNSSLPGTFILNYKVKDSNGCTANDNLMVNVDAPDATFSTDVTGGCTDVTVNFTKDMTGIAAFWWTWEPGLPKDSVNANPTHLFTNPFPSSVKYYDVELKVKSPGGCYATYRTTITVYPQVIATITPSKTVICSGNSITFTSQPDASKYYWEYGDGVSGYGSNVSTHVYTNNTTVPVIDTVKLTTTSAYNCISIQKITVTVMPVPQPGFTVVPATQIFNPAGNVVNFTNTTNAGTWTWLWRFGDGATSTAQSPAHTYTGLQIYNITLVVSNGVCSDSVRHTAAITPIPPVANFDSIPSGCGPLTVQINNTSLNTATPGTRYFWDFGDGATSTDRNPVHTYTQAGTYRITYTVTGPTASDTKTQLVTAFATPRADFDLTPYKVYVNDEKVKFFNLSTGADYYIWEFGDGDTSHLYDPYHKYMSEGTFDITLTAYKVNGSTICLNRKVLSPGVTVQPIGIIRFATVFTPNLNGPIEIDKLPTGGKEIDQFFFPPIREEGIENYKLQIFNRWGTLIFESRNINRPWNGYYKGKLCKQGVYVWLVEGKYANGKPFKKMGDITLLH